MHGPAPSPAVLNQGQFYSPGSIWPCLETFKGGHTGRGCSWPLVGRSWDAVSIIKCTQWPPKQWLDPDVDSAQRAKSALIFRDIGWTLPWWQAGVLLPWCGFNTNAFASEEVSWPPGCGLSGQVWDSKDPKAVFFFSKVTPLALSPQPSELLFYICCGLLCWGSLDCKSPAHHQLPKIPRAPLASEGPLAHGVDPEPHPILPLPATASQASRKSLQHNSPAAKFPGPSLWLSS